MPIDEKLLSMQGLDGMPEMDFFSSFASPQLSSKREQHKESFYGRNNSEFERKLILSARSTFDMLQEPLTVDHQTEDDSDALVEPKAVGDNLTTTQKVLVGFGIALFIIILIWYFTRKS